MKTDVDALVQGLLAADLSGVETLAELQAGMADRAPLFARLAHLEPHDIPAPDKVRLRKALQHLAVQDERVRERIEAEHRGVAEMLSSVAEARGAVRGYRGGRRDAGAVLRTA